MRKYYPIIGILTLACAGIALVSCETTGTGVAAAPPPPNSARLVIDRVANFGSDLVLVVSIDGKDAGTFTEGRHYSGYLSPGRHTIAARVDPNQAGILPARKTLNVKAGQTYSYTASQAGGSMTLVKNQGQSVPLY